MSTTFHEFLNDVRRPAAEAFVKGDASPVVDLSAKSGTATFFDTKGGFTKGASAINEANVAGASAFGPNSKTELIFEDQGDSADLAFWTGYQRAELDVEGKAQKMNVRVTEVFRRIDGEWKMVHRHASMANGEI